MAKDDLTAQRLREVLHYDPETGIFTRILGAGRAKGGDPVGWPVKRHLAVQLDGYNYYLHRLAWLYVHGEWPKEQVDHINGNARDNRIANLRDVPRAHNQQNMRGPNRKNTSGYLGVSFVPKTGRWVAKITAGGKNLSIGYFATREDAYAAYVETKRRLHEGCTI